MKNDDTVASQLFELQLVEIERTGKIGVEAHTNEEKVLIRHDKKLYNVGIIAILGVLVSGVFSLLPVCEVNPRLKSMCVGLGTLSASLIGITSFTSRCSAQIELNRVYCNKYGSLGSRTKLFRTLRMPNTNHGEIVTYIEILNKEKDAICMEAPTLSDSESMNIRMKEFEK